MERRLKIDLKSLSFICWYQSIANVIVCVGYILEHTKGHYLLSFTLRRKSGRSGKPSFNHTTRGVGAPVKRHFSFKPVPSVTTTRPFSLGSTTDTLGATAARKKIYAFYFQFDSCIISDYITFMFLLNSYSIRKEGYIYVLPFIYMQQMEYNK